ncbi:MAG: D-glycero-alpha-D-manno-heptose-1,7-bisphosphate 7-phosphatase [Methylococcaceae bacterium]|nr:HAD family hydrolase [Prolixibacteraceae bacterium]
MNKAVFLDRDGVLINNSQYYYIWEADQMEFIEGVFDNLKLLQQNGYQLFIVSNQGGISRGLYTREDILKLHEQMITTFNSHQIQIRDILFCPHHPDHEKCLCRKPASLMIDKLIAKYDISKAASVMIGDSESDMKSAQLAGIKGLRVTPNVNMYPQISTLLV